MSVGDQDLYVMMNVNGVAGSTKDPGLSSRLPRLVTLDDLNPGQVSSVLTLSYLCNNVTSLDFVHYAENFHNKYAEIRLRNCRVYAQIQSEL